MHITLSHLMPHPLAEQDTATSEVWGREQLMFEPGKSYLVGSPSGKGKSTLLGILFGLRRDYDGEVRLGDRSPQALSMAEWAVWRQTRLSMVFQGLRLFVNLSGWDNLKVKNRLTQQCTEADMQEMAKTLGILDVMDRPCSTWSFGQRQRLAIIRALCQPFNWLLLDEPFSHLDEANRAAASDMILHACRKQEAGLILTSLGEDYGLTFDHQFAL